MYCIDSQHPVPASPWDFDRLPGPGDDEESLPDRRFRLRWMRELLLGRGLIRRLACMRSAGRLSRWVQENFRTCLPFCQMVHALRAMLSAAAAARRGVMRLVAMAIAAQEKRRNVPVPARAPSGRSIPHYALAPRLLAQRPQVARARAGWPI